MRDEIVSILSKVTTKTKHNIKLTFFQTMNQNSNINFPFVVFFCFNILFHLIYLNNIKKNYLFSIFMKLLVVRAQNEDSSLYKWHLITFVFAFNLIG